MYRGLIRKENDLILYRDSTNQLDTLYNFKLNLGDSVLFNLFGMNPEWLEIINVDSILIKGSLYKRMKFAEPKTSSFDELNEVWIEGIGSIHGPLFPRFPVKFSQESPDSTLLTCTFSGKEQVWEHSSYTSCYMNHVLGIDEQEVFKFKIYPNPFTDKIYFENSQTENFDLTVLNSMG
jgi:hypothetical protein